MNRKLLKIPQKHFNLPSNRVCIENIIFPHTLTRRKIIPTSFTIFIQKGDFNVWNLILYHRRVPGRVEKTVNFQKYHIKINIIHFGSALISTSKPF